MAPYSLAPGGHGSLVNQNRQRQASVERHASERADREMPTVRADLPIGIFRWRVAQAQRLARESPIGDAAEPQTASRGRRAEIALVAAKGRRLEARKSGYDSGGYPGFEKRRAFFNKSAACTSV